VYNNGGRGICLTVSSNAVVVNNTFYDNAWNPHQAYSKDEYADVRNNHAYGMFRNVFVNNLVFTKSPDGIVGGPNLNGNGNNVYRDFNFYFNHAVLEREQINENDVVSQTAPGFVNAPPLLGTSGRAVPQVSENKAHEADYDNANPLCTVHWYDTDFSLAPDSFAAAGGFGLNDTLRRETLHGNEISGEAAEDMAYWLKKALPAFDIYGNERDLENMGFGAAVGK
jgi:hypothetical protein